jgi:hypothetical protein
VEGRRRERYTYKISSSWGKIDVGEKKERKEDEDKDDDEADCESNKIADI